MLAMHSLAAANRLRLPEMEAKSFVFETSFYVFGGRIRRFAKVNLNKVNILYCIVLIIVTITHVMQKKFFT